jgi:fructoselysine 6-kinase
MNLLALTACVVDYYPQINKSFLGGNSLNVASMWKKLAPLEHISIITCLGKDSNAEKFLAYLVNAGIDISRVYQKEGTTACNKLKVDKYGERFGIEGAWIGGVYETFFLSKSDWESVAKQNIIAMPGNNPNFYEMIKRKNSHQLLSIDYLDVNNNLPISETVEFKDIAFVSASSDLCDGFKELAFTKGKLIIVTLGAKGSCAFYKGKTYFQPAVNIDNIIDTTGCGDAYQAAFALNFHETNDIQQSMLAGANAASIIIQAWGGAVSQ